MNAVRLAACLAVALVAAYAMNLAFDGDLPGLYDRDIEIPLELHQQLVGGFSRTWQRPPTDAELRQLITDYVREEIAWREGLRLRLGGDDAVLRRRFRDLLESRAVAGIDGSEFTDAMLADYLSANAGQFRVGVALTFRQLFFDSRNSVIGADAEARYLLAELRNRDMPDDIERIGDPSPLPTVFEAATQAEIRQAFGDDFAAQLAKAPAGTWIGPLRSRYGLHLVYIDARSGGTVPSLADVEDEVRDALTRERRAEAIEDMYRRLEAEYDVILQTEPVDYKSKS